jgi:tetratricopeptide (TPR) repeat protein
LNTDAAAELERGERARREKRPGDARDAFARAAGIFRQSGSQSELAHALTRQAQIARDQGSLETALRYQLEALAIQRSLNDRKVLAHIIRHAGDILQDAGRHAEADPYYREMLALYGAEPDVPPLEFANAIRSVALHNQLLGNTEEARRRWREVRDRYAALDELFFSLTGSAENPGVAEADRRLDELSIKP